MLVLLVAQFAQTYPRALALILLAAVVSVASIRKLDHYFATVPQQPPVAPRNIGPLIATLDRLGLDRVYATYWVAYRIDFDTRERIIAAQNKLLRCASQTAWRPRRRTRTAAGTATRRRSRPPDTGSCSSGPPSAR